MSITTSRSVQPVLLCSLAFACTQAHAADPLSFEWDLRARHEHVVDDAFAPSADAATLRLRMGLRGDFGHGWSALLEGEAIADSGDDHNSGANGRTAYPAVIDPDGAEVNQAWLGWKNDRVGAILGRQRLIFDNQRWVGNVGWRQNEQTYDALALDFKANDALSLRYAWLDKVHRVSGDDARDPLARQRDLSTHLLSGAFKHGQQQWTGYAWLHDDRDVAAASSATYGLRWTGTQPQGALTWGWTAEIARQRDHADNPLDFSHAYWLLEPSLQAEGIAYKAGWEHLGGNGSHALQTPLATLHAFNGWADKFLVTPARGLDDVYISANGKAGKFAWVAAYHDYRAETASAVLDHYGRELDLSLSRPLWKDWAGMVKVADYRADDFARDTRKVWVQVEYKGKWVR
ncbi:MAG: alginate export family protein [Xanthomonadales bacterium]|nr:alginate export family protein [Xanthomonadales bacterium]